MKDIVLWAEPRKPITLYRPVGVGELRLIAEAAFRAFPPRLPEQPIFYPVFTKTYAEKIARDWNTVDARSGYLGAVTRFEVDDFARRYPIRIVGGKGVDELWIPAEDLAEFNTHILGKIAVIETFIGEKVSDSDREDLVRMTDASRL